MGSPLEAPGVMHTYARRMDHTAPLELRACELQVYLHLRVRVRVCVYGPRPRKSRSAFLYA